MSSEYLIRITDVRARTGLSRSSVYAEMEASTFPKSVPFGPRSVAWVASEVGAWIAKTIKQVRTTTIAPAPGPDLEAA